MKKSNFLGYVAGTAIGLAAMFSPTKDQDSIDNKVLSNLKPENQQEQVMDKSYMPDLSSVVGAGEVYAGGMSEIEQAKQECATENSKYNNCIYIQDLYRFSEPIDNEAFPKGTRKTPFYSEMLNGNETAILPSAAGWDKNGQFSNEVFNSKYSENLQSVLSQYGVNIEKLKNLVNTVKEEESVAIFDAGYILIADSKEKLNYMIPTSPNIKAPIYAAYK